MRTWILRNLRLLEEDFLLIQGNINSPFPERTDERDYEHFIMCWFSPNVSPRAPVSCQRRVCVVIQDHPSNSALCSPAPLIQMILPLLLLLASLLQQYGSEAESSHISKFNPPGVKEQNGEFLVLLKKWHQTDFFMLQIKPGQTEK